MRSTLKLAFCSTIAIAAASTVAMPAAAQQTDCSAGDLRPIAEGWLPTSVGLTLAEGRCEARQFLRRVFTSEEDPDNITPGHVLEASRPQLDPAQQHARDEFLAAERIKLREQRAYSEHMHANMANEAVTSALEREQTLRNLGVEITEPFQKWPEGYDVIPSSEPGGLPTLVESSEPRAANLVVVRVADGDAIVLGPDGIQAGEFRNGQLTGTGEEVERSGAWREGQFRNGQLEGPGVEVTIDLEGKPVMTTGRFVDDDPDGEVTVTYTGGSQQRQRWDDGQLVSVGPRGAPGATPAPAPAFRPSANVTTFQSSLEYEIVPQQPGGTLDGSFESNGQPVGEMIRRYADGTSQRELYENGRVVGRGALSRPGGVPPSIGKVFRPQVPPRSTWRPAVARPAPRPTPTVSSGSGYASVCSRDYAKIQDYISRAGGVDWDRRAFSANAQMWSRCVGQGDSRADSEYRDNTEYAQNAVSYNTPDYHTPATEGFLNEVNRAMSDPNYSADLGPVRGQAQSGGGGASNQPSGGGEDGPAPGTSLASFNVANPTLPQSFQSQYSGTGLSPDTINQQMDSDPELQRLQAQIDSTRDLVTKLRLTIAQLEGRIVILRQSQDYPDARRLIQGMIEARNAAIANCQNVAASPGTCTQPMR